MSDTPETPPREVPRTEDGTDTRDASAVSNRSEKAQHVPEARKRTARSIREAEDGTGTRGVGKIADLERLIETLRAEIVGWKQMERALNAERQRFFDVLEALPA